MPNIRLQKYLSSGGVASRRKSEELIKQGLVKINGTVIKELGVKIDPQKDKVEVEGRIVQFQPLIYYALHKPKGYTSTASDIHATHTVLELLPPEPRVFPVGRLDRDTTGLLILTNDGEFANQLTHPRYEHEKEYLVTARSLSVNTDEASAINALKSLEKGVYLEDGLTSPAKIEHTKIKLPIIMFNITIHEGRKRQVRRMTEKIGFKLTELCRIRIGKLTLGSIRPGKYKIINKSDIV